MANQSVRLKEEQLRREEEKLREVEFKVQREIQVKRQELLAKEDSLKVLEARLGELWLQALPRIADDVSAAQHTGGHSRDGTM
jgi:septin family protein